MCAGFYRLISPTIALVREDGHYVAHTIPAGTVIKVTDEAPDDDRLRNVIWAGRTVMMFAEDLRSRTEAAKAVDRS